MFNNVYEFFNPGSFLPLGSPHYIPGRSSGFYMNPATSGKIILLGSILSYGLVPKKYRIFYFFLIFIGILFTFSRSALIAFILFYFILSFYKEIDFKYSFIFPIIIVSVLTISMPYLQNYIQTNIQGSSNILNRISWFTNPEKHSDYSAEERLDVANKALYLFETHPFLGKGLGATRHWNERVSAHNIYLTNMAEFGIIGLFIFPLLLYSLIYRCGKNVQKTMYTYVLVVFFLGFFSHMLLDEFTSLYAYAILANLGFKNFNIELSKKE
ncbi:O-antigen ligase family protein [Hydrogenimonas urashimensis]|uniref:O-antigen ligase family protein n=1 Tax=Hydrogenimonas urashimensis TaxID=2740515 RepID=UPI0019165391|nr:O-antigen ligase family protein [Hydrogenimonas urashimensis]